MAKKGTRIVVTLECTECRTAPVSEMRSPGVSRYTTEKNRRNNTERLEYYSSTLGVGVCKENKGIATIYFYDTNLNEEYKYKISTN